MAGPYIWYQKTSHKENETMQLKVLLTTIDQPLGIESETCTKNIQAEMYHAQVTLAQGPFSIRAICTGWGLEFIAVNLNTPTTVMHYPTRKKLIKDDNCSLSLSLHQMA